MANICIQVRVGKLEANKKGREYKFSIGDIHTKISNEEILDTIEQAIFDKLTSTYGNIMDPR